MRIATLILIFIVLLFTLTDCNTKQVYVSPWLAPEKQKQLDEYAKELDQSIDAMGKE